ncbi:MAG: hypothetical protein WCJ19_04660 [bacterium]
MSVLHDSKVTEIFSLYDEVVLAKLLVEDVNPEGIVERRVHIVVFTKSIPSNDINVGDIISVEGNTISNCKFMEGVIEVNNFKIKT